MKVSIIDRAALAALRPLDLAAYLRANGWAEVQTPGNDVKTWKRADAGGNVLHVEQPLHSDWRDYHVLVRYMLEALADLEKRSQLSIVQDLTEVSADVVRLRAVPAGDSDGTIALQDSRRLIDCAQRAVLAAACAAIEPKRAYHTRKPKQATDFADTLRAGQTERGSYVVTVLSRVSPALEPPQLVLPMTDAAPVPPASDPYERHVMVTLATALSKLHGAALDAVASASMAAFEAAIPCGVSADLCEAVALLRDSPVITRLDIRITWAAARPGPRMPILTTFTPDTFEVLREAGRHLRERGVIDDFELSGPVVMQARPDQTQISGDVTVATKIDGKDRKVVVELFLDDWKTALQALDKGWLLRCEGELHRDGKPARLKNARGVKAVKTEDDT